MLHAVTCQLRAPSLYKRRALAAGRRGGGVGSGAAQRWGRAARWSPTSFRTTAAACAGTLDELRRFRRTASAADIQQVLAAASHLSETCAAAAPDWRCPAFRILRCRFPADADSRSFAIASSSRCSLQASYRVECFAAELRTTRAAHAFTVACAPHDRRLRWARWHLRRSGGGGCGVAEAPVEREHRRRLSRSVLDSAVLGSASGLYAATPCKPERLCSDERPRPPAVVRRRMIAAWGVWQADVERHVGTRWPRPCPQTSTCSEFSGQGQWWSLC
mmetsp:Transcript_82751/g.208281  ORF Transcript_82751/g.208281 Transcript_82751/m.208281 type:complete len:275 (-) Transcript_82751:22-846(-)